MPFMPSEYLRCSAEQNYIIGSCCLPEIFRLDGSSGASFGGDWPVHKECVEYENKCPELFEESGKEQKQLFLKVEKLFQQLEGSKNFGLIRLN